jgi:hypothetical protein
VRRALEAAQLPVRSVAFKDLPDGGESVKTALATDFGADFEPPLLFVNGSLVGRDKDGVSPHDYFQASISFDGETCPTFDGEMGIQGSPELDRLIQRDMVQPARAALE